MKITKFDKKACTEINRLLDNQSDGELIDMIIMLRALIVLNGLPKKPEYLELSDYLTHEACSRGIKL